MQKKKKKKKKSQNYFHVILLLEPRTLHLVTMRPHTLLDGCVSVFKERLCS